jgi:amino acid transporter
MAMPDAGSEIAYTERVFPKAVSFATGWMMMLAYLIVCPWEAVTIGRLAAYLVPQLARGELYRVGGAAVYALELLLGVALTALITLVNYRGIRISATFQTWTTFALLAIFFGLVAFGIPRGDVHHMVSGFSHSGWISVLLVLQIVPYFMTGFESVPKCAEEARIGFPPGGFFQAILAALLVGVFFYVTSVAIVGWLVPWQSIASQPMVTAVAFQRAFGSEIVVDLIVFAALLSLVKIFNGNFIAASRLLFALGRRGLIHASFGRVHERNQTPFVAVLSLGGVTIAATLLGNAILVPITEVGSMASALGWLASCAAYERLHPAARERWIAAAGMTVAVILIAMKLFPFIPGSFTRWEWLTLAGWTVAGAALHRTAQRSETKITAASI